MRPDLEPGSLSVMRRLSSCDHRIWTITLCVVASSSVIGESQSQPESLYAFESTASEIGSWRRTVFGWEQTNGIESDPIGTAKPNFRNAVISSQNFQDASSTAGNLLPFACAGFLASFGVWTLTRLPSSSKSMF